MISLITRRIEFRNKLPYLKRIIYNPFLEMAVNLSDDNVVIFDIRRKEFKREDDADVRVVYEYRKISYTELNSGDNIFQFENDEDRGFTLVGIIDKYGTEEYLDEKIIPILDMLSKNKIFLIRFERESVPKAFLATYDGKSIKYEIIGVSTTKYKAKIAK